MPAQPLLLPLLFAAVIAPCGAATDPEVSPGSVIEGEVIEILDGDTVTLQVAGSELRVRLAQIDAPEKSQPYGREAKAALTQLAAGRSARLTVVDMDRYGRTVAELYVGDLHVNAEMVRRGHAWAYTRYARTVDIIDLEDEARQAVRGLWALPESQREAPWIWRHQKSQGQMRRNGELR